VLRVTAYVPARFQPLDNLLDRVIWTLGVVYADTTCKIRVLHGVCSFIITRGRIKPTSLDSQIIMFTLLEGLSIYGSLRPSFHIAVARSSGLASYLGHHNCGTKYPHTRFLTHAMFPHVSSQTAELSLAFLKGSSHPRRGSVNDPARSPFYSRLKGNLTVAQYLIPVAPRASAPQRQW